MSPSLPPPLPSLPHGGDEEYFSRRLSTPRFCPQESLSALSNALLLSNKGRRSFARVHGSVGEEQVMGACGEAGLEGGRDVTWAGCERRGNPQTEWAFGNFLQMRTRRVGFHGRRSGGCFWWGGGAPG